MSRRQRRLLLLLVFVGLASPSVAASHLLGPPRLTWRGTITTTSGLVGNVTARAHYHDGRDVDPTYVGRLRCRGLGCPLHRGTLEAVPAPSAPVFTAINEVLFGSPFGTARRHPVLDCYVNTTTPPADFAIEGAYVCTTVVPPEAPPVRVFSQGMLSLALLRPQTQN